MNRVEAIERLKAEFLVSLEDLNILDIDANILVIDTLHDNLVDRDGVADTTTFVNNDPILGYSAMPEKLALWTVKEAYFSDLIDTTQSALTVQDTYQAFDSNPFTGDYVNLYSVMESWRASTALFVWDDSQYIRPVGEACTAIGYVKGFRRAPIPTIPYMVDTFTPMPDIPPGFSVQDVYNEGFIHSLRTAGGGSCGVIECDWLSVEPDEDGGANGLVLSLDIDCLKTCLFCEDPGAGTAVQVLARDNTGKLLWLDVSEC